MSSRRLSLVVWKVSLPIIFVEANETFDHLIDTLFLARVGVTELGTIGVADAVMGMFLILPLALVDGIQILTARRLGQRRPEAVGAVFNQGMQGVLLFGLASMAALKLLSPLLSAHWIESEAVGGAMNGYLQLDAFSIPLVGVTFACSALLTSLGRTRALIPATLILAVTDIVLNYLFIFGKLGCPALGIRGAAIGSIGAELATVTFLAVYLRRCSEIRRFSLFRSCRFDRRTVRLLGRISTPMAAQSVMEDVRWLVFFFIIERVGVSALAVANIVYTCYIVFWIPAEGFLETACSMVGRYVGRNRGHRIGEVLRSTTVGALLATTPFIALGLLAPQWLAAAFFQGSELDPQSDGCLRITALAMLVAIPGQMWLTAVVGTGDTAAALGIEVLVTLVMLGLTWFAAIQLAWPMALVWLSLPAGWLVCLAVSYGWVKSGLWKRLEL